MKCEKCGVEITEGNLCNNCKNAVPVQGQTNIPEKKNTNVVLIIVVVVCSMLLFGGIVFGALTYFTMKNVNGMFDQAKVYTFVTEVQKYMDIGKTSFMKKALEVGGKPITFSNLGVDGAFELEDLDSEDNKNYYIVFDRNANYTDLVIFDEEYCYKADLDLVDSFEKTNVSAMDVHIHHKNDSKSGCAGKVVEMN